MPAYPESIDYILSKGNRAHVSKSEIAQRRASEQRIREALEGDTAPPAVLTIAQRAKYKQLADQLAKIGFTALDADCLTRYIIAQEQYLVYVDLAAKAEDTAERVKLVNLADKFFNEAHRSASALGLTPISRLKIRIPADPEGDEL